MEIKKLMGFDLGELAGGVQLILDYKEISQTQYYVIAVGPGPKINIEEDPEAEKLKEEYQKNNPIDVDGKTTKGDYKIRVFQFTQKEDGKCEIKEFITLKGISKVFQEMKDIPCNPD